MALLASIKTPADVRKFSPAQLASLTEEMRVRIVEGVSRNGGHLASNLGVVELTLALHYVYDFGAYPAGPDRLLFDVGHQSYAHKMLTGRAGQFQKLRKKGSVSGFPSPDESPFDLFSVGHAGTAISTAVGMARGDQALNRKNHVVAMIGDSSIVNGMSFEGLNAAGTVNRQLLMILNDNGMSISHPQGAFAQYLERIRVSETYEQAKHFGKRLAHELPMSLGTALASAWHLVRDGIKGIVWAGQMFETLGIRYLGPIDGHDLPGLINTLAEIKDFPHPVLLHVKTVKGKGYDHAIKEPTKFHSPASFRVEGCRVELNKGTGKSWTTAFADAMIELANSDSRVVALTAAMPDGTGLSKYEKVHPTRYYDTGICESHLMGMAAGLAKTGLRPFTAVYSTFTQRCYDQIWQEVVLNKQPVCVCMDRAGFVGDDGAVHHGFMDQSFLRPLPGIVLMAPSDEAELNRSLRLALALETASAVRYPRDNVPTENYDQTIAPSLRQEASGEWQVGKSRTLREGSDATLIVYGALAEHAMTAADELSAEGISVCVVDARFCKPLDVEMLTSVLTPGHAVLTVEDHSLQNGFGSAVLEYAVSHRLPTQCLTRLGMPDRLIAHATRKEQLAETGLDAAGIAASVRDAVREASRVHRQDATAVFG
jgi:1-deoxy-D-xylulose-5-phosphate synthase